MPVRHTVLVMITRAPLRLAHRASVTALAGRSLLTSLRTSRQTGIGKPALETCTLTRPPGEFRCRTCQCPNDTRAGLGSGATNGHAADQAAAFARCVRRLNTPSPPSSASRSIRRVGQLLGRDAMRGR